MIRRKPNDTLCWDCAKAYGKCSWSDGSFTPVDGWDAQLVYKNAPDYRSPATKEFLSTSYIVKRCPQFIEG